MKKTAILIVIILIAVPALKGQWYTRKYGVAEIGYLSTAQLNSAKADMNDDIVSSGFIAVGGGLCYLIFRYIRPGVGDDPSFFCELLGDKGVNKLGMGCSIAAIVGGTTWWAVSMGRMSAIKTTIRARQPYTGSITISPDILPGFSTGRLYSGLTLSIRF